MATQYTEEFKRDAVRYWKEHPELGIGRCAKNLGISKSALSTWGKAYDENEGSVPTRGRGNYESDKEDKIVKTDSTETALSIVREQLTELQLQQDKICEYLEKGVYTVEMFTKRNDTLTREIHRAQVVEAELVKKQESQKSIHDVEKEIIPTTQHILDSYPELSVEEKNRLWKIVMERITAYRTPDGEVSIHIYPKLPMR